MIKNTSAILSLLLVIFALTEGKADGGVHVHVVQTVARKSTLQLDSSSRHDNMNNDQQQGGSSYNNADDGNMNGGVQVVGGALDDMVVVVSVISLKGNV